MSNPTLASVESFYDARLERAVQDFVNGNPRVERAWNTLIQIAPRAPRRVLEVGCGIGAISWRMSRRWPQAAVLGLDLSTEQLQAARTLFPAPSLQFVNSALVPDAVSGFFGLVVLMDVYEHIAPNDRGEVHRTLAGVLGDDGVIFLSAPTPRHQRWLRKNHPEEIQPIDEEIAIEALLQLAADTQTEMSLYHEVDVWHRGDYFHAALRRPGTFAAEALEPAGTNRRWWPRRRNDAVSRKERASLVRSRLGRSVD